MKRFIAPALLFFLFPASAFALEGIGPRVTVTGTVQEVKISDTEEFQEYGGQYTVKAENGQLVTIILDKHTKIISEGRLSRKSLLPENVSKDMQIRVRGWRVGSDSLTASLVVIMNIELNPSLSLSGIIQTLGTDSITVLSTDGQSRTFTITNDTEVNINYTLRGKEGLSLIGKQALITMNPQDSGQVRILRVTGNADPTRNKPSTVELKRR